MKKYLNNNAYGNAVTNDLWNALTSVAQENGNDVDVARIMNKWIHITGYPVVTLSFNRTSGMLVAEQERFLFDKTARTNQGNTAAESK